MAPARSAGSVSAVKGERQGLRRSLDEMPVYAGEMRRSREALGAKVTAELPTNCFEGGQATNCRVNAAISVRSKAGRRFRPLGSRLFPVR